jgi:hypothetical protein
LLRVIRAQISVQKLHCVPEMAAAAVPDLVKIGSGKVLSELTT